MGDVERYDMIETNMTCMHLLDRNKSKRKLPEVSYYLASKEIQVSEPYTILQNLHLGCILLASVNAGLDYNGALWLDLLYIQFKEFP